MNPRYAKSVVSNKYDVAQTALKRSHVISFRIVVVWVCLINLYNRFRGKECLGFQGRSDDDRQLLDFTMP